MSQSKSQLTCAYCSKILKCPTVLPCGHSICRDHLIERDVLKGNKIKCKECNEDYQVKDNEFKSNEALKQLIESRSYLSEDELRLKQELEESIGKFFQIYDEFTQNKAQLESDVFDHFQEMRFKIDQHREKIKIKIEDIYIEMIEKTKAFQAIYLKNLDENFSSFNDCKPLESELNEIEEAFRNPNLLIEAIKDMQQRQEESLKDIQLKLNEMSQVKDHLKATNKFQKNCQDETSLFGSINSNGQWPNSFKSLILNGERQLLELIKLCEFSPNDKWSLLYRGTRDGFDSYYFHSKCDGHSNTLTILKAKGSEFIFGGFTAVDWDSTSDWKSDPNAFLFSLTNKYNKPFKLKIDPDLHEQAIYCRIDMGPGFGEDIIIHDNSNRRMDNFTALGNCYTHPSNPYGNGTDETDTTLAGPRDFALDEIEVYEKE